MSISATLLTDLAKAAKKVSESAYCPYSRFPVGAAILARDQTIHVGCNIENASYGETMCAERVAVFKAVAEGKRQLECITIYTPTDSPTPPCGACRQVIREFAPDCRIVCLCDGTKSIETTLSVLLPHSFGPDQLE